MVSPFYGKRHYEKVFDHGPTKHMAGQVHVDPCFQRLANLKRVPRKTNMDI